jgi:hypothetical protein
MGTCSSSHRSKNVNPLHEHDIASAEPRAKTRTMQVHSRMMKYPDARAHVDGEQDHISSDQHESLHLPLLGM